MLSREIDVEVRPCLCADLLADSRAGSGACLLVTCSGAVVLAHMWANVDMTHAMAAYAVLVCSRGSFKSFTLLKIALSGKMRLLLVNVRQRHCAVGGFCCPAVGGVFLGFVEHVLANCHQGLPPRAWLARFQADRRDPTVDMESIEGDFNRGADVFTRDSRR